MTMEATKIRLRTHTGITWSARGHCLVSEDLSVQKAHRLSERIGDTDAVCSMEPCRNKKECFNLTMSEKNALQYLARDRHAPLTSRAR